MDIDKKLNKKVINDLWIEYEAERLFNVITDKYEFDWKNNDEFINTLFKSLITECRKIAVLSLLIKKELKRRR